MTLLEKQLEAERIAQKSYELEKKIYRGTGCLTTFISFIVAFILVAIMGDELDPDKYFPVVFTAPIVLGIVARIFSGRRNKVKKHVDGKEIEELNKKFDELYQEIADEIRTSDLKPIDLESNLILKKGEIALLEYDAARIISKEKVIRYNSSSSGTSVRIAKGVSFRVGSGKSVPVRAKVDEKYLGKVILTNKRIVFSARDKGFEIPLSKVTTIDKYTDGFYIQAGEKNYTLISAVTVWIDFYLEKLLQTNDK